MPLPSLLDSLLNRVKSTWQNYNQNTPAVEHSLYTGASDAVQAIGHAAAHPLQTIAAIPHAVASAAKKTYDIANGAGAEATYAAGLGDNNQENRQKFLDLVNSYKEHWGSLAGFTDYLKNHPYAVAGDILGVGVPALRGVSAVASKGLLGAADIVSKAGKAGEAVEGGEALSKELAVDPKTGASTPVREAPQAQAAKEIAHSPVTGEVHSLVEDEQPSVAAQAQANEQLAPHQEIAVHPETQETIPVVSDEQPPVSVQAQANEQLAPQVADANGQVANTNGHPENLNPLTDEQYRELIRQERAGKLTYLPDIIDRNKVAALPEYIPETPYETGAKDRFENVLADYAKANNMSPEQAMRYFETLPDGHPFVDGFQKQLEATPVVPRDLNEERITGVAPTKELTPAEQQEMDASVKTPPSVNNATDRMENVSTDAQPPVPANDPTRLAAVQNFGKNLLSDERGSLGYKGEPAEAESSVTPDMKTRLYDAISDVKPKLGEQRVLNRENLREKVAIGSALRESGADVQTQKAVLDGSPTKVDYQPLKDQFTPEEQAAFKDDMNANKNLSFFDNTMAQDAFDKLTGTHPDGGIPTQSELDALQKAYPQLKGKLGTAGDYLSNFLGIARATKTIGDLGVALRQASPLIGTKEYWKALGGMLSNITSEQRYQSVMDGIRTRPNYDLMREAKIAFTDLGHDLVAREDFAPSVWAEKIPGVRQSERGFTGFLNQIRADTADRLINVAKDQGINVHDGDFLKQLGDFVNNTTGRGSFGQTFDKAAPLMASVFFSPRLMASRVKLLGIAANAPLEAGKSLINAFKPGTFETMHPMMQKEYMKALLGYTAFQTATMAVMKGLGAKIETDPRSADFARGTFGDTHFDMTGGFQPYVRAAAQIMTLSKKNASGDIVPLNDGKTLGATAGSVGLNLLRGKLSPMVGFGLDMALGKDFAGNKVSPKDIYQDLNFNGDPADEKSVTNNPAVKLYIPMAAGAMMDAMKEYGAKSPLPYAAGAAEIFGGAAHTYEPHVHVSKNNPDAFSFGADPKEKFSFSGGPDEKFSF